MSSANSIGFRISDTFSIPFIYKIKSNGPNIDPCGTPHVIVIYFESALLYDTYCLLLLR